MTAFRNVEGGGNVLSPCTISVVVPNLNGEEFLPECLASLYHQTFRDFKVIVVDNGSKDSSVTLIERDFPWVGLITLPENRGFSYACNIGVQALDVKYAVVLNNDTEVEAEWLEGLYRSAEKSEKIGMVSSKILLSRNPRVIDSAGMLIYPDGVGRQRGRGEVDKGQFDREEEILFAHGCAALYRRDMLDEIGLFDEDFFAYAEDTDLGLRGRLAGWKAVYSPAAVVYHKYSRTSGTYSSFKAMHLERNRFWVALKNFPLPWLFAAPLYTLLRHGVQVYSLITGRGSTARYKEKNTIGQMLGALLKAHLSAARGIPLMMRKRTAIRRTISGKEFAALLKKHRISVFDLVMKD